jgi:hypothetical protein
MFRTKLIYNIKISMFWKKKGRHEFSKSSTKQDDKSKDYKKKTSSESNHLNCAQEDLANNSNDKEILIITNKSKSSGRNMEPQNKGNIKSFATDSNYKSIS